MGEPQRGYKKPQKLTEKKNFSVNFIFLYTLSYLRIVFGQPTQKTKNPLLLKTNPMTPLLLFLIIIFFHIGIIAIIATVIIKIISNLKRKDRETKQTQRNSEKE